MLLTEFKVKEGKVANPRSAYNPGKKVRLRMAQLRRDNEVAQTIMGSTYEEFGSGGSSSVSDYDLISRMNWNQKMFNQHKPSKSNDPDNQWHSNALKPIIRNKIISIVAHITSQILYPSVVAQNDEAVEDKDMASVMEDAVVWACEQSDYEDMFIDAVQEMCVNPAIVLYQDYADVKRKIKEKKDGKVTIKEIVDEIYSGFIASIVPLDELYIGNVYEPNIQKQPFLIRRKIIDYTSASRKYGDNENFKKYVTPGLKTFYNEDDDLFYDDYDDQQEDRLVEELVYYNYHADLELRVVNGVLLDDPDRGMQRADKMYPFAKSVYETYNSRFFYGMSLAQKLQNDEEIVNTLYNMIIDGTYLQLMPPISVYGETDVDASDFNPRSINAFADPNVKVEAMQLGGNLTAGMNTLQLVEESMSNSSKQEYTTRADTTAREISYMEEQTKIMLGRTGKMISSLIRDFGQLQVNSIVQHVPIAELSKMTGDSTRIKFPVLFLADQEGKGGLETKKIEFTNELPEADTEEELEELENRASFDLLQTERKLGMTILKARPETFRDLKYIVKIKANFLSQSTKFAKSMMMFDRLIGNPIVDQRKLLKDTVLKELKPGHENEFLIEEQDPILAETQKMANQSTGTTKTPPTINNQAFSMSQ